MLSCQRLNAEHLATEGDKDKLCDKNSAHYHNELGIQTQIAKRINMLSTGIKAVKGNGHHKGSKESRF